MEKKYLVLEGLIKEYIKNPEPVSSKQLQQSLDIELSSATIRYYFKQLTQKGYLQKKHISSGRIPSQKSLQNFWRTKLKAKEIRLSRVERFEELSYKHSIVCEYSIYSHRLLSRVERCKERFLVAMFEDEELVLPLNEKVEELLKAYIGKPAFEVAQVCADVGLIGLSEKIKDFITENFEICNIEELVALSFEDREWAKEHLEDIVSGKKLAYQKSGLSFSGSYMSYKFTIHTEPQRRGEVLLMGRLYRDYDTFLKNLRKE